MFAPKGAPSFVDPAPLPFRALPWVGFDYEKHRTVVFFSAQDDTRGGAAVPLMTKTTIFSVNFRLLLSVKLPQTP